MPILSVLTGPSVIHALSLAFRQWPQLCCFQPLLFKICSLYAIIFLKFSLMCGHSNLYNISVPFADYSIKHQPFVPTSVTCHPLLVHSEVAFSTGPEAVASFWNGFLTSSSACLRSYLLFNQTLNNISWFVPGYVSIYLIHVFNGILILQTHVDLHVPPSISSLRIGTMSVPCFWLSPTTWHITLNIVVA